MRSKAANAWPPDACGRSCCLRRHDACDVALPTCVCALAASVSRLLDAAAGYVVKRIRQRHVVAVSQPADLARVLHVYADLGHVSVVREAHGRRGVHGWEGLEQTARVQPVVGVEASTRRVSSPAIQASAGLVRQKRPARSSLAPCPHCCSSCPRVWPTPFRAHTQAIPELVSATATQLMLEIAARHEQQQHHQQLAHPPQRESTPGRHPAAPVQRAAEAAEEAEALPGSADGGEGWEEYLPPELILSLLRGYQRLGYYPGQALVTALLVPLSRQLRRARGATLAAVLRALADMRHSPGAGLCGAMVREVRARWAAGEAGGGALALGWAVASAGWLGHAVERGAVEDACRACLFREEGEGGGEGGRRGAAAVEAPPAALTCGLLLAAALGSGVTIRQLGMACVALREARGAGSVARLPAGALAPVAEAAEALGEEGWEMVDEVSLAHVCVCV